MNRLSCYQEVMRRYPAFLVLFPAKRMSEILHERYGVFEIDKLNDAEMADLEKYFRAPTSEACGAVA